MKSYSWRAFLLLFYQQKKLFFGLSMFATVLSCFGQQTIELNNWKFKTGDNFAWAKPGYDDSLWSSIKVGDCWESQGYSDYDGRVVPY